MIIIKFNSIKDRSLNLNEGLYCKALGRVIFKPKILKKNFRHFQINNSERKWLV